MGRRVGLSGLFLDYPYSGTWTYTRNLVRELPRVDPDTSYSLATRYAPDPTDLGIAVRRAPSPFRRLSTSPWRARLDKLYWEVAAWPWAERRADLLHSLHFAAPMTAPSRVVVTVHDVIPLRLPGYARSRAASWYAGIMKQLTRRASAVITVSQSSRNEIAATLDYPRERIFVTLEAPDPALQPVADVSAIGRARARYGLPERYILYVGGSERRKNVETLVTAWQGVRGAGVSLVLVGAFPDVEDALYPDIPGLIRRLGLGDTVHTVGRVAPEDMAAVYSGAVAFCYPSLHEGFGLPPIEAMACGTAVLCSDASSLPEVAGPGAELIAGMDAEAWREALDRVIEDADWRQALALRGRAHASTYSWTKTASATVAVYDWVLAS